MKDKKNIVPIGQAKQAQGNSPEPTKPMPSPGMVALRELYLIMRNSTLNVPMTVVERHINTVERELSSGVVRDENPKHGESGLVEDGSD